MLSACRRMTRVGEVTLKLKLRSVSDVADGFTLQRFRCRNMGCFTLSGFSVNMFVCRDSMQDENKTKASKSHKCLHHC